MLSGFLSKEDASRLKIPNNLYQEIIEIWTELSCQNLIHANYLSDIKLHPIWNNSGIRNNNQPVFYKTWSEKGVNYIEDILYSVNSDYRFMSLDTFTENTRYKPTLSHLVALSLQYVLIIKIVKRARN